MIAVGAAPLLVAAALLFTFGIAFVIGCWYGASEVRAEQAERAYWQAQRRHTFTTEGPQVNGSSLPHHYEARS